MIVKSGPSTGCNPRSPSIEVSGRLPSSLVTSTSWCVTSLVSLLVIAMVALTGTISSSNLPACFAAAVRCCDWSEYWSIASRLML